VAQTGSKQTQRRTQGGPPAKPPISSPAHWGIAALLAAAVVFTVFLLSKHFGGSLPGCGPASACEELERTAWGRVPGIGWPVSFAGFAWFLALLAGWMVSGGRTPVALRWLVRAGGAASVLFLVVMIAYRKFCPYCVAAHAANLAALFLIEREARRTPRPAGQTAASRSRDERRLRAVAGSMAGTFLVASLVLGIADARLQRKERASAEADRRASTEQILAQAREQGQEQAREQGQDQAREQGQSQAEEPGQGLAGEAGADRSGSSGRDLTDEQRASPPGEQGQSPAAPQRPAREGFTGRYRLGPEASPIRIVILTDYQCVDCNRVEPELAEIVASRQDVSLSVKHFPMCAEAAPGVPCNPYATRTMHPNACWAARAAEAAGLLKGNDGFWQAHRWLFSRAGNFTESELAAAVGAMGFDPAEFLATMKGPETLRRVRADCEEGYALGLYFTPMVFINGVEFKGWQVPGALRRTVEEVAAKNPPPLTAAADRPPSAAGKDVQDWRDQPVRAMPPDTRAWTTGAASESAVPAGARFVDVVLFGDYQEPFTAAMDVAIRERMKTRPNVRYTFRHFPIDPKSNPTLPPNVRAEAIHPLAGRAAQAAEAAGALGGASGYWKMHDWLMRNLNGFSDASLRAAATQMGLDADALFAEMDKPAVAAAIVEDARAGQALGLTGVPMVFVNGKWVWRTTRGQENIVLTVMEGAGGR